MDHFYQHLEGWFTFPGLYSHVVNTCPTNSHFVEVGAFLGKSASFMAVEIINSGKPIKFDCVDTWQGSIEHGLTTEEQHKWLYNKFLQNIEPVKNIINPIKAFSVDAAKQYADSSLDFVFIDAGHEYEDVKADLEAWYPKVNQGGIIAGHDYFDPADPEHGHKFPGVKRAVDEFFSGNVSCSNVEYSWFKYKI